MEPDLSFHVLAETRLPTKFGSWGATLWGDNQGGEHVALTRGVVTGEQDVLVRMHSKCLTGDVFASERCDCGQQLKDAMQAIDQAGCGILLYLDQEGRGIGLANKFKAYNLQDEGLDTVEANLRLGCEADSRDYSIAVAMLHHLGPASIRLLTNNPTKLTALGRHGLSVEQAPLAPRVTADNSRYLTTKVARMGHLFEVNP